MEPGELGLKARGVVDGEKGKWSLDDDVDGGDSDDLLGMDQTEVRMTVDAGKVAGIDEFILRST